MNTSGLLPVLKAWDSFVLSTIENNSSTSEMAIKRVFTLLSILYENEVISAGELIASNFKEIVDSKHTTLGHNCLINLLCEQEKVPVDANDIFVNSEEPIK